MTVSAILSRKGQAVETLSTSGVLGEAVQRLSSLRIGALVVTDRDGRVAGMISERDVVKMLAEHGAQALSLPVEQVMTRNVSTCTRAETVGSIMERMTHGKFRHLPVVEDGQLGGIISIGDVVKYRLEEIERESEALREYILTA